MRRAVIACLLLAPLVARADAPLAREDARAAPAPEAAPAPASARDVALATQVALAAQVAPENAAPERPGETLARLTGLGPLASQAIVHTVRVVENAIPVVVLANVEELRGAAIVELVYTYSANEVCVRDRNAEGREALRAAREACRGVRGVNTAMARIRCTPRRNGTDGCAPAQIVWHASLFDSTEGRPIVETPNLVAVNIDADVALERVIDFEVRSFYDSDEGERGPSEVDRSEHEVVVLDDDGAVLLRETLSTVEFSTAPTVGKAVAARVRGTNVQISTAECAPDDAACDRAWRSFPIVREAPGTGERTPAPPTPPTIVNAPAR